MTLPSTELSASSSCQSTTLDELSASIVSSSSSCSSSGSSVASSSLHSTAASTSSTRSSSGDDDDDDQPEFHGDDQHDQFHVYHTDDEEEHKDKRHIYFAPEGAICSYRFIPHIDDMMESEIQSVWYNRKDYEIMKSNIVPIVRSMMNKKQHYLVQETDEITTRGLEYRTRKGAIRRQHNKVTAAAAVLEEQERNYQFSLKRTGTASRDDDKIRSVYKRNADHCLEAAQALALQDQAWAETYYEEEDEQQPSSGSEGEEVEEDEEEDEEVWTVASSSEQQEAADMVQAMTSSSSSSSSSSPSKRSGGGGKRGLGKLLTRMSGGRRNSRTVLDHVVADPNTTTRVLVGPQAA